MPQIVNIAIDRLFPHSDNPRKDLGDLSELAASIKASGILQNLTVAPDEPDNSNTDFTIIIGHRRYAEVGLSFDGGTTTQRALEVCSAIEATIHGELTDVYVAVYPVAEPLPDALVAAA